MNTRQGLEFLHTVYTLSHAGQYRDFNAFEVGRNLGYRDETIRQIFQNLSKEGLIDNTTCDYFFCISNRGLDVAEKTAKQHAA